MLGDILHLLPREAVLIEDCELVHGFLPVILKNNHPKNGSSRRVKILAKYPG